MNLLWRLAFRNLFRNRRRSLTTGIAIAAGFIGLSLLGAYIFRAQRGLEANTVYVNLNGHLQIHKKDSMDKFSLAPKKYLIDPELDAQIDQILARHPGMIEFQGRFLTGSGLLVADKISLPFIGVGIEREIIPKALNHPVVQRWAKAWSSVGQTVWVPEVINNPNLISITPKMAAAIGRPQNMKNLTEDQKYVQLVTRTFYNDLNAVNGELGLIHTTGVALADDTSLRMSLKLLQELLATDGYQYRALFLVDGSQTNSFQKELQDEFQKANLPLEVFNYTQGSIGEFYVGTMNFLYVMGTFFVILICGMVSLSIVNSLTLGVLERTKELGTLKALGFSSEQIVGIFVRETIWLAGLSILFGFIASQTIARIVNASNIRFTPPAVEGDIQFYLEPEIRIYLLLSVMLFAIAVVTAYRVSKTKMKSSAIELLSESGV